MAEFTLLKLQFEDASFAAHAPFSGASGESAGESSGDGESADVGDADGEGNDRRLLPLVVGLAFLVVVAVAVKKLRSEDDP
ncbi:MAG: hypothetical protein BRD23_01820 [Halobacteriales archaeon SW_9_67_25]|jgi:hypothetical protein|nr:MAG: hypothetical protein BRD23_01820 [Halobacteriales archaeon SW_9_67_25]